MQVRFIKTFFVLLALVTVMIGLSLPASAHVSTATDSSHTQSLQVVNRADAGCPGLHANVYAWGEEWYLPPACAKALKDGANVLPIAGQVASGALSIAMDLSCNGSVYIDVVWVWGAVGLPPTIHPRPAC